MNIFYILLSIIPKTAKSFLKLSYKKSYKAFVLTTQFYLRSFTFAPLPAICFVCIAA